MVPVDARHFVVVLYRHSRYSLQYFDSFTEKWFYRNGRGHDPSTSAMQLSLNEHGRADLHVLTVDLGFEPLEYLGPRKLPQLPYVYDHAISSYRCQVTFMFGLLDSQRTERRLYVMDERSSGTIREASVRLRDVEVKGMAIVENKSHLRKVVDRFCSRECKQLGLQNLYTKYAFKSVVDYLNNETLHVIYDYGLHLALSVHILAQSLFEDDGTADEVDAAPDEVDGPSDDEVDSGAEGGAGDEATNNKPSLKSSMKQEMDEDDEDMTNNQAFPQNAEDLKQDLDKSANDNEVDDETDDEVDGGTEDEVDNGVEGGAGDETKDNKPSPPSAIKQEDDNPRRSKRRKLNKHAMGDSL